MNKLARILVAFSVLGCMVDLASAGKKTRSTAEETILGPISCTVANKPAPQAPGNGNAQGPGGTPQAPVPGGTNPPPAPPPEPITSVKDCLGASGQVVILPDGQTKPLVIENPEIVEGHEWHRLSISGFIVSGGGFRIISVRTI